MKKQHIKRMRDEFEQERRNFVLFLKARKAGTVPPQQVYDFKADMETLNAPYSLHQELTRLVFEQVSPTGAELFITPLLLSSLQSLKESLALRNELIAGWKQAMPDPFPPVYFGVWHRGMVDRRYRSAVEAIFSTNDDVIAFSMILAESFEARAKRQRDFYNKKFRTTGPTVNKVDFSAVESYLPERGNDIQQFVKMLDAARPVEPLPLHQRLWGKLRPSGSGPRAGV
jgi:hypothetical protein